MLEQPSQKSSPAATPGELVRPTVVQFNLRQLLKLTLAVSVVAALIAPLVRNVQDSLWQLIAVHLGLALVSGGAVALWFCRKRRQVELRAGRERLCIRSTFGQKWWSRHLVYFGWCWVFLQFCWNWYSFQSFPNELVRIVMPIYCSIASGAGFAMFTLQYWWRLLPATIEVCERGLISGGTWFVPWSEIRRWSFSGSQKPKLTFFAHTNVYSVSVAPELVDQVEQIFAEYLTRGGVDGNQSNRR